MRKFVICFIIILMSIYAGAGQKVSVSEVTDVEVKEASAKTDLNKMKRILVPRASKEKEKTPEASKNIVNPFGAIGQVFKMFAILVIAAFAILLLYLVFKDVWRNRLKNEAPEIELDNIQDITAVNFETLLKDALDKKDYRLATRIKFLTMLQILQNKQKIVWKPNKTNRAYTVELADGYLGNPFKELSSIFERVWYGHKDIDAEQYGEINTQFESMQKLI